MNCFTIRLDEYYNSLIRLTGDDELFNEVISRFTVYYGESEVEDYLKKKAMTNMKMSRSVTFISLDKYSGQILGFYTIAITYIPIMRTDDISVTLTKKLRATNIDESCDTKIATSYLIGQLGRSVISDRGFGKILLSEAIDKIVQISEDIGCNVIRIDCKDDPDIISFYEKNEFFFIKKCNQNGLNIMIRYVRSI